METSGDPYEQNYHDVNRIHKLAVYLLYSIMLLVSMKIVNWTPMIAVVYYSGKSSFIAF